MAAQRLDAVAVGVVAQPALRAAAATSCLVVSQGGRTLYAANPLEALIPASNMKLLTATAVLDRLGPTHRLTTDVAGAAPGAGWSTATSTSSAAATRCCARRPTPPASGPGQTLYTSLDQLAAPGAGGRRDQA